MARKFLHARDLRRYELNFCFSPSAKYSTDLRVHDIYVLQKQSKSPYLICQKPGNNYESNLVKTRPLQKWRQNLAHKQTINAAE